MKKLSLFIFLMIFLMPIYHSTAIAQADSNSIPAAQLEETRILQYKKVTLTTDSTADKNERIVDITRPMDGSVDVSMQPGETKEVTDIRVGGYHGEPYYFDTILEIPDFMDFETDAVVVYTISGTRVDFTLTAASDAPPGEYMIRVKYSFHFGTGDVNSTEILTINLTIAEAPGADFSGSPRNGVAPLTVEFTDRSSGQIDSWEWEFGDGESSTSQNPSHTYQNAGAYTVTLKVTGPGGSDTKKRSDYISVSEPAPVADFTGSPTAGVAPLTVQFTDKSTGKITDWDWDFGDGQTSSQQNPSHTYTNDGTYTVELKVTGPGGSDTKTRSDYIKVNPPAPVADFIGSPTQGTAPLTVQFTDKSTGDISDWDWDFGDGLTSTDQNPSHTYPNAGSYTVKLIVTGPAGSDSKEQPDYITVEEIQLSPPQNLMATISGNSVTLSWDAPGQTIAALAEVTEIEPNDTPEQAQALAGPAPVVVTGNAEVSDQGSIKGPPGDDIEDLFVVTMQSSGINVTLTDLSSDLDLIIMKIVGTSTTFYGSIYRGSAHDEEFDKPDMEPGTYYIGVSIYDPAPVGPSTSPYTLTVTADLGGDDTPNLQSYNIYRSNSSPVQIVGQNRIGNVAANTTSFMDTNLTPGSPYYYAVTAVYDQGESPPSNEVKVDIQGKPRISVSPDTLFFSVGDQGTSLLAAAQSEPDPGRSQGMVTKHLQLPQLENRYPFSMRSLAPTLADLDTLGYSYEGPFYCFNEENQIFYEATKLIPANTCELKALRYGFWNYDNTERSKECALFVWDDNGGTPDTLLWSADATITLAPDEAAWINFDLSNLHLNVNTFWMGHLEKTSGAPSSLLDSVATPGANYYSSDGANWTEENYDYLHQAVVAYSTTELEDVAVLTAKNIGNADLVVQNIACVENWVSAISSNGFTLTPGAEQNVEVTCSAEGLGNGSYVGTLKISSNDPDTPVYDVPMVFDVSTNHSPTVVNTIPETTLVAGDPDFQRDLDASPALFTDPDGDQLTYTVSTSAPSVASAAISGSVLSVSPLSEGSAKITVTADDGRGGQASMDFAVRVGVLNPPENLTAASSDTSVQLTWQPPASTSFFTLEHYCIYCSRQPDPLHNAVQMDTTDANTTSFTHDRLTPEDEWYYAITAIYDGGRESPACTEVKVIVDVEHRTSTLPTEFALKQNYPNPFNPTTTMEFDVPAASHVSIRIYDVLGHEVKTLVDERYPPGTHSVVWDARDDDGRLVASGAYLVRMQAGEFVTVKKVLLLK